MAGPYRESDTTSIDCPRCNRAMPPGSIAACTRGCGVWVNAETAQEALFASEIARSRLTSWFRERVPCPHCNALMTLRGTDMALFQGCEDHGYWIDDETVSQTGLARPAVAAQVDHARDAAKAMRADEELKTRAEREARAAAERARLESESSVEAVRARLEAEREAKRREEERAWKRAPYVKLLRQLLENRDVTPLADYLMQLEETVDDLKRRLGDLAARRGE